MRIRQTSPLLLLLTPSLAYAQAGTLPKEGPEVLSNNEILELNRANRLADSTKNAAPNAALPNQNAVYTKGYRGTEDAPVDGLDGKPHAGPFVDRPADDSKSHKLDAQDSSSKSKPASLEKFGDQDIPEKNDGVMNDDTRTPPKKGTTGTEGGISEKTKAQLGQDGDLEEKKPKEPKKAPPLPHSEQKHIDDHEEERSTAEKASTAQESTDPITGEKVVSIKKDGLGLEKPAGLPDRPRVASSTDDDFGPPVIPGSGKDKWLVDTMPETEGKTNPRPPKVKAEAPATDAPAQVGEGEVEFHEWIHSFVLSFTMIIFSEIGDKTFLVAALMAMRHDRFLVFSAAISALTAMTVLSAVLGHAFPALLPKKFTTFAAAILFFVFGAKSLKEGLEMPKTAGVGEEMREVEQELEEKEHSMRRKSAKDVSLSAYEIEAGRGRKGEMSPPLSRSPSPSKKDGDRFGGLENLCGLILSPAWVQTFVMTFLGEWGDRSQIATIAMAAGQDYWWVTLGAIVGHGCCTGLAVIGGRALAGRVSMRVVTIGGAIAFLVFGLIYVFEAIAE